ncbi:glycoside hydrolase family 76 protein [Tortispora caseinolytica NRRL Y-17796]|uniref:Mannan endo-1,6-alpha-mannosidase n=1 Tax=Tortispora caseinolytica NRRL Y-17796 TaxID=767744 RepID=A0A1E4TGA9_9ASCO|nr:glycoside hydrolase family 76 protein [Tortispora caseinolytica NRRL Y-17796]
MSYIHSIYLALVAYATFAAGIALDINSEDSIKSVCNTYARGLMDYYNGDTYGGTPGMFVSPYYWWQAGGAWGSMIDFWAYTGNDTYNDIVKYALLFQVGSGNDYMPANQTVTEGNDDQAFWGIAAMAAAERNFSNPSPDQPQWLYLAQAVHNTMLARWDNSTCGGGLRWQIFSFNNGYNYKNSISNAGLFQLAGRLARYTRNDTYVDNARKVIDWMDQIGLVSQNNGAVYDGTNIEDNCTQINAVQWTYNVGMMMAGCAYLYNYTEDPFWLRYIQVFLSDSLLFFPNNIMTEVACQTHNTCNTDQKSFRAYFSRFLGLTYQLVPEVRDTIYPWLQTSATGAAGQCDGGIDGVTCGMNWDSTEWDGSYGLGQQMSALEVTQNLLIDRLPPPLTADTGASSTGDYSAGTTKHDSNGVAIHPSTTADRAGAGVVTAVVLLAVLGGCWWIVI